MIRDGTIYITRDRLRKLWLAAELLDLDCPEAVLEQFVDDGLAKLPVAEIMNAQTKALSELRQQWLNKHRPTPT